MLCVLSATWSRVHTSAGTWTASTTTAEPAGTTSTLIILSTNLWCVISGFFINSNRFCVLTFSCLLWSLFCLFWPFFVHLTLFVYFTNFISLFLKYIFRLFQPFFRLFWTSIIIIFLFFCSKTFFLLF